jgi:hypothetical protein
MLARASSRPGWDLVGTDPHSKTLWECRAILGGIDRLTEQITEPSCSSLSPCPVGVKLATCPSATRRHTAENPSRRRAARSCPPVIWRPRGHGRTSFGLIELPPPQPAMTNTAGRIAAEITNRRSTAEVSTRAGLPFTRLGQRWGMSPELARRREGPMVCLCWVPRQAVSSAGLSLLRSSGESCSSQSQGPSGLFWRPIGV